MEAVDTVVIGAGVVGLACARTLARAGREVIIVDAADGIGTETSSRNSEVIHAGIYYPTGSLKAQLCVAGKHALYAYAREHGVAFSNCGKLIVATSEAQIAELAKLQRQAAANGVADLTMKTAAEARAMEPALECVAALHSPSTGIVDSHAYMLALQGEAEAHGAMLALKSPVRGGRVTADGIELDIGGAEAMSVRARVVVNSAGLHAQSIASRLAGFPRAHVPPTHYAKGNYYALVGRSPFSRLIYPVPEAAGLGVHVTIDLGGQARFGPDVEWIDAIDRPGVYDVDPRRADAFYAEVRKYWPGLRDGQLAPAYSGIRPKIQARGAAAKDFVIQDRAVHGIPGLVHLFGIESPGLTASLAIADRVAAAVSG
jgi:L-2-hydroxyglutarate oxidase LhgO